MSASENPLIPFTPVVLRYRYDGWTPETQIAFIQALAESACVEEAARSVGRSVASAYSLRNRIDAGGFRDAWDSAIDMGMHRLEQAALSRAINGVARPVFYKGEQVGEWIHHDEKLTMFLLRYRRPHRYGAWHDRVGPRMDEIINEPIEEDDRPYLLLHHYEEIMDSGSFDEHPEPDPDDDSPHA